MNARKTAKLFFSLVEPIGEESKSTRWCGDGSEKDAWDEAGVGAEGLRHQSGQEYAIAWMRQAGDRKIFTQIYLSMCYFFELSYSSREETPYGGLCKQTLSCTFKWRFGMLSKECSQGLCTLDVRSRQILGPIMSCKNLLYVVCKTTFSSFCFH